MNKVRENRLRRVARRRGLALSRSRRRDTSAFDYGMYALIDKATGVTVHPTTGCGSFMRWTLREIEEWLS